MKEIMLYQHGGSFNHGCEALVTTISEQIKEEIEDGKITLFSRQKKQDEQYNIKSIDKIEQIKNYTKRGTLSYLLYQINKRINKSEKIKDFFDFDRTSADFAKQADVAVAVGGDMYCYGKGKYYWTTDKVIKKVTKTMLWGCSIEPDELPGELSEHLKVFDVITARETITYDALCKNGLSDSTILVSDPAFLLDKEEIKLPDNWKDGNMLGLNLSQLILKYTKKKENVIKSVYALLEYIMDNTDMNVALVPHVRMENDDDVDILKPIYEHFKDTGRIILFDDYSLSCKQIKYIISKCRFFIGARTHATIAAYSTYVPTLVLGYSVKSKGIAKDIFGQWEKMVLPVQTLDDHEATLNGFKYLLENEEKIKEHLKEIMPEYKEKARLSAKALKELIEK